MKTQKKGKDPNLNIINGIHNIKGRTYVNVFISNYTNKHITFNKVKHVGHLEPPIKDMQQLSENSGSPTAHSITTKEMMAEKVEPDPFKLPCYKLMKDIQTKLEDLVKEYESQFAQDETTIGTIPLTKMTTDTKNSEPVSQKPYPITMKHYNNYTPNTLQL